MKKFFMLCAVLLAATALANATTILVDFPSTGSSYFSATNGSGTIPSGGQTAYMSTLGDYVTQTFTGTGLSSVTGISYDVKFLNDLWETDNELVVVLINGTQVDSFYVSGCAGPNGYCNGERQDFFDSQTFPAISSLDYTLTLELGGSIGSIAFSDSGSVSLTGTAAVPEPSSLALLGSGGLALLGAVRRKLCG